MTTPDVQALFKRHFGATPTHVVRAPGSVELLGNCALCADGLVISAAIGKGVCVASTPRADGKIELASSIAPGREVFRPNQAQANAAAPWADDFKRITEKLRRRGVTVSGFNAAIFDELSPTTDFGRTAAHQVAAALTLRQLFPFSLGESGLAPAPARNAHGKLPPLTPKERVHFAKLCEPAGWLGAASSLLGKAWHALNMDLRFGTVEPADLTGEVIVVCEPESAESSSAQTSGEIRAACDSAVAKLGAKSLRSIELSSLKAAKSKLTPREYECASHAVGELARVVAAERALRAGDHRQFGQFIFQSHESARDLLQNVPPEASLLVELARAHPGCLGSRHCTGASAAVTLNLVSHHQAEAFMAHMLGQFESRTSRKLRTHVLQTTGGAV